MNKTIENIFNRYSCRKFTEKDLTEEQVALLEQVALASPSGGNGQKWHFSVCWSREIITELDTSITTGIRAHADDLTQKRMEMRNWKIFCNAPLLIVCSVESDASDYDAGCAIENLAIAAQSMGLGSCIMGGCRTAFAGENGEKWRKIFRFPEGYQYALGIAIGYPEVTALPHKQLPEKLTRIRITRN